MTSYIRCPIVFGRKCDYLMLFFCYWCRHVVSTYVRLLCHRWKQHYSDRLFVYDHWLRWFTFKTIWTRLIGWYANNRQALHYLKEEYLAIGNSNALFSLEECHLLEAVKSDYLQASELDVLSSVVKWGEHRLLRRMEERGNGSFLDRNHQKSYSVCVCLSSSRTCNQRVWFEIRVSQCVCVRERERVCVCVYRSITRLTRSLSLSRLDSVTSHL